MRTGQNGRGSWATSLVATILFLLLLIPFALADNPPTIHSITAPPVELGQQQTIQATITDDGSILNVRIILNATNATMTEGLPSIYSYTYTPEALGNVSFTITAIDNASQTTSQAGSFIVQDTTPPEVIATTPSGTLGNQTVSITATTNENAVCRTDTIDTDYASMGILMEGTMLSHQKLIALSQGTYTYYVRCTDLSGNAMPSSEEIHFILDLQAPLITINIPVLLIGPRITISITTDEQAQCRYDTAPLAFESMLDMTGSTEHSVQVDLVQGTYQYYFSCQDTVGNEGHAQANFSVNVRPTAAVRLEKGSPLRAGTYQVSIDTSEVLQGTPSLQYGFDGESGRTSISLVGSGTSWSGYLIIHENTPNKVGTFYFRGNDEQGLEGTTITDGELFLIDTTKPPAPSRLVASNKQDGSILLRWHYDGERIKEYRIYRTEAGSADYVDYYQSVGDEDYVDAVDADHTYSYAVSAVDRAGNEGPLSGVTYITALGRQYIMEETVLDPKLASKVNRTIVSFDLALAEMDRKIKELEGNKDDALLSIITEKGLLVQSRQAREDVAQMRQALVDMLSQNLSEQDVNKILDQYEKNIQKDKAKIPQTLSVIDGAEFTQSTATADVLQAQQEYLIGKNVTDDLTKSNQQLQDMVKVTTKITQARITYAGGLSEEVTVFQKTMTLSSNASYVVVELIPKEVARRASDVTFKGAPQVLNPDPVVVWDGGSTVTYSVDSIVPLSEARQVKTILLLKQQSSSVIQSGTDKGDKLTGAAIKLVHVNTNVLIIIVGIIIIAGLAGYYFFSQEVVLRQPLPQQYYKTVQGLLHDAHAFANRASAFEARHALVVLHQLLQQYELPPLFRMQFDALREKVRLLDSIAQANTLAGLGRKTELRTHMAHIRTAYSQLSQSSPELDKYVLLCLRRFHDATR
ncbi:MAG: hypothetical protein V1725_03580 [archaeon]